MLKNMTCKMVVALAVLLPFAAGATPPRVVSSEERIFAENKTHIFILRSIKDNLGFYNTVQTDIVLIARNLITGGDDNQWPVLSILDYGPVSEDYNMRDRVENFGVLNAVYPFEIITERGAGNLFPDVSAPWRVSVSMTDQAIVATDDTNTITHAISLTQANAQLFQSLQESRQLIPPYKLTNTGEDGLLAAPVDIRTDCQLSNTHTIIVRDDPRLPWDDPTTVRLAAHINCGEEENPLSAYIVLPPQAQ